MWSWDQGRLDYFQFDELRKIARFALRNDLKAAGIDGLSAAVGLKFLPNDPNYKPWRNYSRTFKLSMIASVVENVAAPTPVAKFLASDGNVTSDEYYHFLAQATSDPSPALSNWDALAEPRFPLLFALKFALARASVGSNTVPVSTIIGAYETSRFSGEEDQTGFLGIVDIAFAPSKNFRQARESLLVLSLISYINYSDGALTISLAPEDAANIFKQLEPIRGARMASGDDEIQRISRLFSSSIAEVDLEFGHTVLSDTEEAGFPEGGRVERTHLKIERNSQLRQIFFATFPSPVCDFCGCDTQKSYPWSTRVLDLHHVLPLCSGTRTSLKGTVLDDLVANCPTCHRAVHGYYSSWLRQNGQKDFTDADQAKMVYAEAKTKLRVS